MTAIAESRKDPTLLRGEIVWVTFGSFGRQLARVLTITRSGRVQVRKWRQNSRTWTKPVTVTRQEILYEAQGPFPWEDRPLPGVFLPAGR